VPQEPNDEPASVLLERIRAEKARLIKEKKIKPSKPLPPISSDEMPFDLPKGWMWVKLGDFCQFDNGHAFKSRDYVSKSKNKLIRLGNVKNNQLLLNHNSVYLSDLMANQRKECLLKKDDLLVTMTGTKGKKDFGFTALVQSFHLIGIDLYLNQRVGRIRKISMTSMSLVSLFMGSSSLQDLLLRDSTGTANQANISASSIRNLLFPLPPLAEQKRIVATVDRLMTHCDQLQTQLQTRSDRAHTLLHSAIHQLSQTP
jgi:type I restriction enzyme S subunit